MKYLRSPAPVTTAERTIVDLYIEKQTAFARAQSYLEAILIKNAGLCPLSSPRVDIETNIFSGAAHEKAGMSADELAIATSEMKRVSSTL